MLFNLHGKTQYVKLHLGFGVLYEIAYSYADLWFQLFKNVENRDIIHIFSSEKLRPPEAALRMLKDKRSEDLLKIHYTGSSFQGYYLNVEKVLKKSN